MPAKPPQPKSGKPKFDQDNAWKDMLDRHFPEFLEFFFPEIHVAINWGRKPIFLDKELAKLAPKNLKGKRLADKLAKVWLKTGQPLFVVLHSEIQGQALADFNERMYVYNYRIKDREDCPVVSLGIITGDAGKLELGRYETLMWGCHLLFEFPVARIVEWRGREQELLASKNPFALVVLAQLKVLEATGDVRKKYLVKRELIVLLQERGYSTEATRSLLRFLDWLIRLPEELDQKLENEFEEFTEGKPMPYVTSWERIAEKRGRKEGKKIAAKETLLDTVLRQLKRKVGKLDNDIKLQLEKLSVVRLKKLAEALLDFSQPDDLERWLKRKAG
jgi:hypothetical protein